MNSGHCSHCGNVRSWLTISSSQWQIVEITSEIKRHLKHYFPIFSFYSPCYICFMFFILHQPRSFWWLTTRRTFRLRNKKVHYSRFPGAFPMVLSFIRNEYFSQLNTRNNKKLHLIASVDRLSYLLSVLFPKSTRHWIFYIGYIKKKAFAQLQ